MLQQAPNVFVRPPLLMSVSDVVDRVYRTHRPLKRNSYYSDAGERNIGGGLVLWRGFFQ